MNRMLRLGMSLRTRLTLWYGVLLALTLLAFSALLYFTLQQSLSSSMDERLTLRADHLRREIGPGIGNLLQPEDVAPRQLLEPFAEDTYLHQVVVSHRDRLVKYTDLPEALLASDRAASHPDDEWRVHFHVPIFLARMAGFDTTQAYLSSVIGIIKRMSIRTCLEVETRAMLPDTRSMRVCARALSPRSARSTTTTVVTVAAAVSG